MMCTGEITDINIIPCRNHDDCAVCDEDYETEMDLYRYWR